MSIPVEVADLGRTLQDFDAAYLLTTSSAGTVKVVSVLVDQSLDSGSLLVPGPGRGSLANVGANPAVTLLFPPQAPGGMSLLVDGTGTGNGEDVEVVPTSAVLHKAAT